MSTIQISDGLAHEMPDDLKSALISSPKAVETWESISAIARNEWICWTVTVKQEKTRLDHVKRAVTELAEGKRRPCCWMGCIHRTDKALNPTQQWLIDKQNKREKVS